jgi:hypothetical protein
MTNGCEELGRRRPDALRRRVGRDQLGEPLLDVGELADELVVRRVGDLGFVEDVVAVVVELDLRAELFGPHARGGEVGIFDAGHGYSSKETGRMASVRTCN